MKSLREIGKVAEKVHLKSG